MSGITIFLLYLFVLSMPPSLSNAAAAAAAAETANNTVIFFFLLLGTASCSLISKKILDTLANEVG